MHKRAGYKSGATRYHPPAQRCSASLFLCSSSVLEARPSSPADSPSAAISLTPAPSAGAASAVPIFDSKTALSTDGDMTAFGSFISEFGKKYPSTAELEHRFGIFTRNSQYIEDWNKAADHSGDEDAVRLGMNQFGDLTARGVWICSASTVDAQ